MRKEDINVNVTLDDANVCEQILWMATNTPDQATNGAKAMSLAFWDEDGRGTAKMDLWTKKMEVHEMKAFCIETIAGLADTLRNATNDEAMAMDIDDLCRRLSQKLKQEMEQQQQ